MAHSLSLTQTITSIPFSPPREASTLCFYELYRHPFLALRHWRNLPNGATTTYNCSPSSKKSNRPIFRRFCTRFVVASLPPDPIEDELGTPVPIQYSASIRILRHSCASDANVTEMRFTDLFHNMVHWIMVHPASSGPFFTRYRNAFVQILPVFWKLIRFQTLLHVQWSLGHQPPISLPHSRGSLLLQSITSFPIPQIGRISDAAWILRQVASHGVMAEIVTLSVVGRHA